MSEARMTTYQATEYPSYKYVFTIYSLRFLKWFGYYACVNSIYSFCVGKSYFSLGFIGCSIGLYRFIHWIVGYAVVPSTTMSIFQRTNQDFFEEQLVKIADKYAPHLRRESDKYFSYFPRARQNLRNMGGTELTMMTIDGVDINGFHIPPSPLAKKTFDKPMAVIMLVANAEFYEIDGISSQDCAKYARQGFDVIMCNYRGTGKSGTIAGNYGWYRRCGLILDADAAIQYTRDTLKIPIERMFIITRSLGGAVGTEIASIRSGINLCNARSFDTLSKAAECVLGKKWGPKAALGIRLLGWDFDGLNNWKQINGYKWIESISNDSLLQSSILFNSFHRDDDIDMDTLNVLQMKPTRGDTHNRPLTSYEFGKRMEFLLEGVKYVNDSDGKKDK